jgi:predicted SprT family Zn-dependent metalloprotease
MPPACKRPIRVQHNDPLIALRRPLPTESDLQLVFARMNATHFAGEIPAHRIVYNARLKSVAGRITYRPPVIELSAALHGAHPGNIEQTLLHEMVHAWLYARRLPCGHGRQFRRKMGEVGLTSIYHPMPVPHPRSHRRYVLECLVCGVRLLRKRRPGAVSCARCYPARFNARFAMSVRTL